MSLTTGYGTRISFGAITLKEVEVTPMGLTLDPSIEQTSNANTNYASFEPGDLITKTPMTATCKYNIADMVALNAVIKTKTKQSITTTYSDGATSVDIGWLVSFAPDPLTRGSDPSATIVIDWEGEAEDGTDNLVITPAV